MEGVVTHDFRFRLEEPTKKENPDAESGRIQMRGMTYMDAICTQRLEVRTVNRRAKQTMYL